jgi:hypothetical protein
MSDLKSSITGIPETTEAIHNSSYNIESSRGDFYSRLEGMTAPV